MGRSELSPKGEKASLRGNKSTQASLPFLFSREIAITAALLLLFFLARPLDAAAHGVEANEIQTKTFRTSLTGKGSKFAVSPDGSRLLFATGSLLHGLSMLDLLNGRIEAVPMEPGRTWEMPSWSADGKQVVAISTAVRDNYYIVGDMQLILIDPGTWKQRTISSGAGVTIFPFFSADGKSVYYFKGAKRENGATPASRFDLYAIDLASGKEQRLTHEEFYQVTRGDDDGKTILFGAIPGAKTVKDAFSGKTQNALLRYSMTDAALVPITIDQSSGISLFSHPERDTAGNLYFVAAKLPPGSGRYQWFVFRADATGKAPIALAELPIGLDFELARRTGEIWVMDKLGDEIVFRRLRVVAEH